VKRTRGGKVLQARSQEFQIKQIPSSLFAMGKRKARKEAVRFAEYQPAESANAVSLFMNGCLTGIIGREEGRRFCPVESGSSGNERCYYLLLARSDRRAGEIIFISAEPMSVCVSRARTVSEPGELKKPFDAMVSGARSFSRISVAITNDERHQCQLRFRIPLADPSGIVRSIISVEHNCDEFQETRTDKSVNKDGKY